MIPHLLHQTSKTAQIPPTWKAYQATLIRLHPGWTYRHWTDADNLQFVRENFPDFVRIYTSLPHNIMRADVIRYLLMYKLGGLYLDFDYEMLKPFDLADHDIVLPWESEGLGPGKDLIGNCIFAAEPGHPYFKLVIDELTAHPPMGDDVEVLSATGPAFLTRMYYQAVARGMQLFAPDRMLFHAPTPRTPRQYKAIVRRGTSYGVHHCHGTWRSWTHRVRLRVAGVIKRLMMR